MTLTQQMIHLSQAEFWGLLLFASAVSLAGFYFGFRWFMRARLIENTPTAKIRSAHQGYVELAGSVEALPGEPLLAPLTGTVCCWYRYKIEKRGDKHWRTVESDTSDAHFLLRDETGRCLVDPEGAEVTASERSVWYGHSRYPEARAPAATLITAHTLLNLGKKLTREIGGGRYRYSEERIYDGAPLYAIGLFKSQDDLDRRQMQQQQMRDLLRAWKQDRAQLMQRFDLNQDGEIDPREWELVRQAAARQSQVAQEAPNDTHTHRLSAPNAARYPFLLSTLPEFGLVKRYRLQAAGGIALFFVAGVAAVWMLSALPAR